MVNIDFFHGIFRLVVSETRCSTCPRGQRGRWTDFVILPNRFIGGGYCRPICAGSSATVPDRSIGGGYRRVRKRKENMHRQKVPFRGVPDKQIVNIDLLFIVPNRSIGEGYRRPICAGSQRTGARSLYWYGTVAPCTLHRDAAQSFPLLEH